MALILSLVFLFFSGAVGLALQSLPRTQLTLKDWLLAPALGMAALVVLLTTLSIAGVPVKTAAPLVIVLGVVLAAAGLMLTRPFAGRFAAVSCAALLLGTVPLLWPLVQYGFDWISFANDDMVNYVFSAMRFVEHGYFDLPAPADVVLNRNLPLDSFNLFAARAERTGAELLLAMVMAPSRLSGFAAYMPVAIAFQAALVGATAALASHAPRPRSTVLAAIVLMSLSPMAIYPVLYQLTPQILGGAFVVGFCAECTLWLRGGARAYRTGVFGGLLFAAATLTYPEMLLIAFPALAIAAAIAYRRGAVAHVRSTAIAFALVALVSFNVGIVRVALTVWNKIGTGRGLTFDPSSFLDYLLPSGLPMFFGLIPIAVPPADPLLSILIAAGAVLLVALAWQACRIARSDNAVAAWQLLVYLALFVQFFISRQTYAGFKARFYAEPFLVVVVSLALARLPPRYLAAALAVIALAWIPTDTFVIARAIDTPGSKSAVYTSLNHATTGHVVRTVERVIAGVDAPCLLSTSPSRSLAKIEGAEAVGRMILYSALDPADNLITPVRPGEILAGPPAVHRWSLTVSKARQAQFEPVSLRFPGISALVRFSYDVRRDRPGCGNEVAPVIVDGPDQSVLNRRYTNASRAAIEVFGADGPRRLLAFVDSTVGTFANFTATGATLYKPEPDYFRPAGSFSAVGQQLLFEIIGGRPNERVRFVFASTSTLNSDGENRIPDITVFGRRPVAMRGIGRGAAYRMTEPVEPLVHAGHRYVVIDFGTRKLFTKVRPRTGLMNAYGRDISLDPRNIRAYVRDISVLAGDDRGSAAPSAFDARSVLTPSAPFSGTYEDGWLSEHAMFVLRAPRDDGTLRIDVDVPLGVPMPLQTLVVSVDGRRLAREELRLGDNAVAVPHLRRGRRRVELTFSEAGPLSEEDDRRASALLRSIRIE